MIQIQTERPKNGTAPKRASCPHLGQVGDRTQHRVYPSDEHRCFLWMQRDRVDLAHQQRYCLTSLHAQCPWLMFRDPSSMPLSFRLKRRMRLLASSKAVRWVTGGAAAVVLALLALNFALGSAPKAAPPPAAVPTEEPAPPPSTPPLQVLPADALSPALLTASAPLFASASVPVATGGTVIGGNVGISLPAAALAGLPGPVSVAIEPRPPEVPIPGGASHISTDGTIFKLSVRDATGKPVTTSPVLITILLKYNAADVAAADGDASILTSGFVVDSSTPAIANPLRFPNATWVFFPPSVTSSDRASGTVMVRTQAIPSVMGIVTKPFSYVRTKADGTRLFSGYADDAQVFGSRKASTLLTVAGPQLQNRQLVFDAETNNYAYVNVDEVSAAAQPGKP